MKKLGNPVLSVIVPVYNAENYIEKCIESILNQTLSDLELILVDDGSFDKSGAICDEYAKKDARVKVIHKENGGAASARNAGIDAAQGDYIGFCDADDYVDHDMYETLIGVMKQHDLPTIECLSKLYDGDGALVEIEEKTKELKKVSAIESIRNIYLHKGNVSLCTRVTKANYIKAFRIPEGYRVEDFYFTVVLLTQTNGTAIYSYPFYNCVYRNNSVTRAAGGSIYLDAIYFYEKSLEFLSDKDYEIKTEQEYFLFKKIYLLFISVTQKERKQFKKELSEQKRYLRKNINSALNNPYLSKKEKIVLWLSSISISLSRQLYIIKNIGGKE